MYHLDGASDGVDDIVVGAWGMVDGVTTRASYPALKTNNLRNQPLVARQYNGPRIQQRQEIVVEITFVVFGEIIR